MSYSARPHKAKNPRTPKDERTKFDKWLDECADKGRRVYFVMYDDSVIKGVPLIVDRYNVKMMVDNNRSTSPREEWINKSAILRSGEIGS